MESSAATNAEAVPAVQLAPELQLDGAAPRLHGRGIERSAIMARLLMLADVAAGALACGIVALAFGAGLGTAVALALLGGLVWPLLAFSSGLYSTEDLRTWVSGIAETPRLLISLLLLSWPVFIAFAAFDLHYPGAAAAVTIAATALLSSTGRAGVRAHLHSATPLMQRTLIVGSGVVAGKLIQKLHTHRQFGLLPIGLIDDEPHDVGEVGIPRMGRLRDLPDILERADVDRVIVAFSRAGHEELLSCVRACRDAGVPVAVVPRLFDFLDGARSLESVGGLPMLSIDTPGLNRSSRIAKRALDIALSSAALVALSPLLALIAAAIKLESRGPVLFRQPRVGRDGRIFQILKFRSMYDDAEDRKGELALAGRRDGIMFKLRRDPRITRVGRLLRRLSVDELPQLVNVLRGDMSLVGPRPLIAPEIDAIEHTWQARRLDLRPGMTGPWQVHGRSENPFEEMVRLDYQYVSGWSLARDVEILIATLPAVLSGRGAY
jgi:exopolysaccharide biosynthesis polyprenyl glycosylphosphotransferase